MHSQSQSPSPQLFPSVAKSKDSADATVSVVIPCYNEERFIGEALSKLANQYDQERFEIIVVDGRSEDRTRKVVEDFKHRTPGLSVTLIDNPARNIPTALNLGVAAARGNIVARMDAHAAPSPGYIRRCVEVLNQENTGVVGMPCRVRPGAETLMAQAIAAAVSHPFGIGDAEYRLSEGGPLQESVDTVAFSCFRKSLWKGLDGFNEALLTNEDYDFNYRVRLSGQQVILDRTGYCDYFARTTLPALASQYSRYGYWKAQMLRLHPRSIRLRHLVAPAFVFSLTLLALSGVVWTPAWWLLLGEISCYLIFALAAGWHAARKAEGWRDRLGMTLLLPLVFATIHLTWGGSFWLGMFRRPALDGTLIARQDCE
ncbi:MAG: glycosyltransferase [Pyrinomonadaceae bacterium]